jgi:predicted O-methyltransferase YrrM
MGYTTLAIAQKLPKGGKIYALDISEEWTGVGKQQWEKAGVADKVELMIGGAVESLDKLIADGNSLNNDKRF